MFAQCCCSEESADAAVIDLNAEDQYARPHGMVEVKRLGDEEDPALEEDVLRAASSAAAKVICLSDDGVSPLPKPNEFQVELERTAACAVLGVELDLIDGQRAQVCDIKHGIIDNYNQWAEDAFRIKAHDWIIEVNGVGDDVREMYKKLKADSRFKLRVRRCPAWYVTIYQQACDGSLEPTLKRARAGVSILLLAVHDMFREWNAANPARQVHEGDRIVQVNGISMNTILMMQELQGARDLTLLIMNPNP